MNWIDYKMVWLNWMMLWLVEICERDVILNKLIFFNIKYMKLLLKKYYFFITGIITLTKNGLK